MIAPLTLAPTARKAAPRAAQKLSAQSSAPDSAPAGDVVEIAARGKTLSSEALREGALQTAQAVATQAVPGPTSTTLRVLSLNTYFDSRAGVDKIVDLIKTTKADLVGLQESNINTQELADALGMEFVQQDKRTALLSRFPIKDVTPQKYGVAVELDNGKQIGFLNVHATSFPNQPHQLIHSPKGGGPYIDTEREAIWWADITRGGEFRDMVKESDALGLPTVVTGDFNEPSHLDWTKEVVATGRHPITVKWPGSQTFEKAGFQDSYRVVNPDPLTHPGNTWTPTAAPDDPNNHHDRIDFVMYRGEELKLVDSQVVGESEEFADIVIDPYPTDHRAVLATFQV